MLVGVLMRDDGRALRIQPLIAVGVIEVPMRVDQVLDRIAAEAIGGFQNARARCSEVPASASRRPLSSVTTWQNAAWCR
jgi:hypothetical protein